VRHDGELLRKSVHLASVAIPLAAVLVEKSLLVMVLAGAALLLLLLDYLRTRNHGFKAFFMAAFGELLRKHERQGGITGSTIVVASAALTILVYRQEVAVAALLFLSIGDSAAALVGRQWGRVRLVCGRTLEGSLAALVGCLATSIVLMMLSPFFGWSLTPAALAAGSLTATLAELIDMPLDDNFRIPVFSGLVMDLVIPG
jgi:dolichol kinase